MAADLRPGQLLENAFGCLFNTPGAMRCVYPVKSWAEVATILAAIEAAARQAVVDPVGPRA